MSAIASQAESALGLQAGELYGADEECHTSQTNHQWRGVEFEVYYEESECMWKTWAKGIGGCSHWYRHDVIQAMRKLIWQKVG